MDTDINSLIYGSHNEEIPKCILEPYNYLEGIPSNNNNIRATFLNAFNELYYQIEDRKLLDKIGEVISIFHNSSLLIDDIEDNSSFRRGMPTAHTLYGTPSTINCGNLMYFIALQKAQNELPAYYAKVHNGDVDIKNLTYEILQVLVDEMLNLHHGQGLDIHWRDSGDYIQNHLPQIDEYLKMVMNKTGGLFRLSVKLLKLFSPLFKSSSVIPLANLLGIIYQVRDDYLNLVDPNYSHMKGYAGEDLIEGKLSLPILHCLRTNSKNSPIYRILYEIKGSEERKANPQLVDDCIKFMKNKSKSLEFTRNLIHEYHSKAKLMIINNSTLKNPENSMLCEVIDKLCDL
ncbi:uncharacterized protein AC631_04194 [Debaryomyces fabryi]|uniref:Geranylgeranyl pyrophosphate synthase n=1 Tax=Debaryomyces fabryi TaxID=58627 RepID=A0A0V1PUW9_9ASCO|nr:uncharacterized protein AC631_04194 [Debaryomyces fabryi]KSA00040.1 hypothetical protein AC631_04194 [Debaryomyces fabryi]CUM45822.1 unnamed protein product [Debaryomyces fabryi]